MDDYVSVHFYLTLALKKRDSFAERRLCSAGRGHEKLSISKQTPVIHVLEKHMAICRLLTKMNF